MLNKLAMQEGPPPKGERKRQSVRIDEAFEIKCRRCTEQPDCFVCNEPDLPPPKKHNDEDEVAEVVDELRSNLKFRCTRCKQSAHYEHREYVLE